MQAESFVHTPNCYACTLCDLAELVTDVERSLNLSYISLAMSVYVFSSGHPRYPAADEGVTDEIHAGSTLHAASRLAFNSPRVHVQYKTICELSVTTAYTSGFISEAIIRLNRSIEQFLQRTRAASSADLRCCFIGFYMRPIPLISDPEKSISTAADILTYITG